MRLCFLQPVLSRAVKVICTTPRASSSLPPRSRKPFSLGSGLFFLVGAAMSQTDGNMAATSINGDTRLTPATGAHGRLSSPSKGKETSERTLPRNVPPVFVQQPENPLSMKVTGLAKKSKPGPISTTTGGVAEEKTPRRNSQQRQSNLAADLERARKSRHHSLNLASLISIGVGDEVDSVSGLLPGNTNSLLQRNGSLVNWSFDPSGKLGVDYGNAPADETTLGALSSPQVRRPFVVSTSTSNPWKKTRKGRLRVLRVVSRC